MGRVKSRFVRALVESVQHETGGSRARAAASAACPPICFACSAATCSGARSRRDAWTSTRLSSCCSRSIACSAGGSGVVMARATAALASRVLSQSAGLVVPGDTVRTLQHLRAPFEHPFIDVDAAFLCAPHGEGFVFELEFARACPEPRTGCGWRASATPAPPPVQRPELGAALALRHDADRRSGVHHRAKPRPARQPRPGELPSARGTDAARRAQRRRSSPTNAAARVDQILGRGQAPRLAGPKRRGRAHLAKTRPSDAGGSEPVRAGPAQASALRRPARARTCPERKRRPTAAPESSAPVRFPPGTALSCGK